MINTLLNLIQKCKIIDLTTLIFDEMPVYPGHQNTIIFKTSDSEKMKLLSKKEIIGFNVEGILMSNHESTHVDAPIHVNPTGLSIDMLPVKMFITRGVCLDVSHIPPDSYITRIELENAEIKTGIDILEGDTVLLLTGHYKEKYQTPYWFRHTGLDVEASEWLAGKGIVNIGIDTPNIDSSYEMKKGQFPAHNKLLLENNILIMENVINLENIKNREFLFIGLPLKLKGASGSPIRAVALIS